MTPLPTNADKAQTAAWMRLQCEFAKKRGAHLFFWELAADEICRQRRNRLYGPEVGR